MHTSFYFISYNLKHVLCICVSVFFIVKVKFCTTRLYVLHFLLCLARYLSICVLVDGCHTGRKYRTPLWLSLDL